MHCPLPQPCSAAAAVALATSADVKIVWVNIGFDAITCASCTSPQQCDSLTVSSNSAEGVGMGRDWYSAESMESSINVVWLRNVAEHERIKYFRIEPANERDELKLLQLMLLNVIIRNFSSFIQYQHFSFRSFNFYVVLPSHSLSLPLVSLAPSHTVVLSNRTREWSAGALWLLNSFLHLHRSIEIIGM